MDDAPEAPLLFSDRVIGTFCRNILGQETQTPACLEAIKVVFRQNGGKWEGIACGNPDAHALLASVVSAWGKLTPKAV